MDNMPKMFFYDTKEKMLGSDYLRPIPLYKGMEITINGDNSKFIVKSWSYHHGHSDVEFGLKIILDRQVRPDIRIINHNG
jgi:hypothetical protein